MHWIRANLALVAFALGTLGVLLSFFGGGAGRPGEDLFEQETVVFGTRVAVKIAAAPAEEAQAATAEVFSRFDELHRRFHPWRDGELKRLNARIAAGALPARLSAPMEKMLLQAQDFSEKSEGLFNPAIGALVRLWGFHTDSPGGERMPPPPAAVRALLRENLTMAALTVEGRRLIAAPPAVQLDFGALAKGAALDEAREILRRRGIKNALVNIGGNILALGKNRRRPWRVSLSPLRRQPPAGQIELQDGEAVAISGDSERFFMHGGKRYSHILDPRSGAPVDAAAATAAFVLADGRAAGAISDAAATALVIADEAAAQRIAARFNLTLAWQFNRPPPAAVAARLSAVN